MLNGLQSVIPDGCRFRQVTDEGALKELPPEIVRLVEEMLAESPDNSQERTESPEPGQKQQVRQRPTH